MPMKGDTELKYLRKEDWHQHYNIESKLGYQKQTS